MKFSLGHKDTPQKGPNFVVFGPVRARVKERLESRIIGVYRLPILSFVRNPTRLVILEDLICQFADLFFGLCEHLLPGTRAVVHLASASINPCQTRA